MSSATGSLKKPKHPYPAASSSRDLCLRLRSQGIPRTEALDRMKIGDAIKLVESDGWVYWSARAEVIANTIIPSSRER
jgi:hypothetical protein